MKKSDCFFACMLAPAMPLQALVRSEPALSGAPLVTVDGEGTAAHVEHVTAAARTLGVRVGMTPSQARSLAPDVVVRRPSPGLVRVTAGALTDLASSFSHSVQVVAPGMVLMDVTGHQHIHGSFELMGRAIVDAAATNGLTVRTGFAAGAELAAIAARTTGPVTVFMPGSEAGAISHLGIRAIGPSPALLAELARLKISRIGELAALPASGVGTRLGTEGVRLHRLARGIDDSRITAPVVRGDRFEECVALDYALDNLEPLMFLLSGATDRIVRRMDLRGLCPGGISLTLTLDPAGFHTVGLRASGLAENPSTIATLLHRALMRDPPAADVNGFMLAIEAGTPASVQCQLFGPPAPEPRQLRELAGRLAVIVGDGNAGSPAIDENAAMAGPSLRPFRPGAPRPAASAQNPIAPVLAFRRFVPPVPAEVEIGDGRNRAVFKNEGAAAFFQVAAGGDEQIPARVTCANVSGRITRAAGPWYADSGWWTDEPRAGAFYDIEVPGRGVFRLWHDLLDDTWFLDGIWD